MSGPPPGLRLSIVIPCLDEARTIARVVAEAHEGIRLCGADLAWAEVVVSDNGSTDGSRQLASEAGARVVDAPVRGYGAALHWGIVQARGDVVLLADADMSHDLTLLPRFVEAGKRGEHDLVLGSRLAGEVRKGSMPLLNRYVGTPVLNFVIWLCFGLRTSDCNSGMRLVRRDFYERLGMRCPGMEWASELLIKSALRGGRYAEVPIHVRPDERGRPPHLRRWRDGWRHFKSIVMLAPNVTILAPALVVAAAGGALTARGDAIAGFAALWFAYVGALVGLAIKLILHVDGIRPSRFVGGMLRLHAAELGMFLTFAFFAAGAYILAAGTATPPALVGGAFLVAAGGATALGVLYLETIRTLLVSDLDRARKSVEP